MSLCRVREIAIAALLFAIMGCSSSKNEPVGKWQNVQLGETVEFMDNNTGIFDVKDMPSLGFKWSSVDKHKVKLEFKIGNETKVLSGTVKKDLFILKGDSKEVTYKKVKVK